jgi:circadian clock protein KaiB
MNGFGSGDATGDFERALSRGEAEHYVLRLYVAGSTPQSTRAIVNIKQLCEQYLEGRYELEVVDIYQQPEVARSEQLLAAPTLIKKLPLPLRKLIGNMSDLDRVLLGLDIVPSAANGAR